MYKKIAQLAVYLTLLLIPLYIFRFSILGIRTNILEVAILISFVLSSLYFSMEGKRLDVKSPNFYLPIFFILASILSLIIGGVDNSGLGVLKGWVVMPILFYFSLLICFTEKDLPKISRVLLVPLFLVSIIAILQRIGAFTTLFYQIGDNSFKEYIEQGRIFGIFESPNYLAMFIVPLMFLTLPTFKLIKKQDERILLSVCYLFPILAVYFSESRAGMIALFISIFVFLNYRFINLQKAQTRKPFRGGIFVAILLLVNSLYLYAAANLLKVVVGGDVVRVQIYQYSLQLLKTNYLFGIGLSNFQDKIRLVSTNNVVFQDNGLSYALHPHNLILAIWLYLGALGIIAFLLILIRLFMNVFSSNSVIRAALIASIISILIHGLFDTTFFKNDLAVIFWLILAFSVILNDEEKSTQS